MPEKFGIENLQKVFTFGVTLGKAISTDLADNNLTLTELFGLVAQLSVIPDLLKNKDAIIAEAKDLSITEIQTLVQSIEGVITNQKVVAIIEHALDVATSIYALIQDFQTPPAA